MKVEIVYKTTVSGRPSKKSAGLKIDGKFLNWKQIEETYGIDNWVFMRRRKRNPAWALSEILTTPKYVPYRGNKRQKRVRTLGHTPEQLEANKIACGKWR